MRNEDDRSDLAFERKLIKLGDSMARHASLKPRVLDQLEASDELVIDEAVSSKSRFRFLSRFGEMTMFQRLTFGGLAAGFLLTLTLAIASTTATVSFAQVVANIRSATSYSADVKMIAKEADVDAGVPQAVGKFYWRAPGDVRMEFIGKDPGEETQSDVEIYFRDRAGISLAPKSKTYRINAARRGVQSPIMQLQNLVGYQGNAVRNLGKQTVNGSKCTGFEIPISEVDASAGQGTLKIWVNIENQLPVSVTMNVPSPSPSKSDSTKMIMDNIRWNEKLNEDLFNIVPPEGYTQATVTKRTDDQQLESIISALELFAELNGGSYPQVKVIYGDVTLAKLHELAGYAGRDRSEFIREENYKRILESSLGWGTMNMIMRDYANAAYNGLDVGPQDKDKVLFRWTNEDGLETIIYGDLHSEKIEN